MDFPHGSVGACLTKDLVEASEEPDFPHGSVGDSLMEELDEAFENTDFVQ